MASTTRAISTKGVNDKAAKAPVSPEKPVPSQVQADDIREEAAATTTETEAKPTSKAKKTAEPTSEVPYPTQADLDAMKAGTYGNRELKSI